MGHKQKSPGIPGLLAEWTGIEPNDFREPKIFINGLYTYIWIYLPKCNDQ